MPMDLQQVYDLLSDGGLISLATVEDDQPRVRVVSLIADGQEYYFVTFRSRDKVAQLIKNDRFEFFYGVKVGESWGSIRASGRAVIVEAGENKNEVLKVIPFFNDRLDPLEEQEYALVRLDIEEFMVQDPEDGEHHRFVVRKE